MMRAARHTKADLTVAMPVTPAGDEEVLEKTGASFAAHGDPNSVSRRLISRCNHIITSTTVSSEKYEFGLLETEEKPCRAGARWQIGVLM